MAPLQQGEHPTFVCFTEQEHTQPGLTFSLLLCLQTVCLQCACLAMPPKQLLVFTHWPIFSQSDRQTKALENKVSTSFMKTSSQQKKRENLFTLSEKLQHEAKSHETQEQAQL